MKTVRQIMAETNALDNVALMKQMMAWPYERKVRHAGGAYRRCKTMIAAHAKAGKDRSKAGKRKKGKK